MEATILDERQREASAIPDVLHPESIRANRPARAHIGSLGVLFAHALAIEYEAEACYRDLAARMADFGNDTLANLFVRLAEFEGAHALHLVKKSLGIEIPLLAPGEYAWLDSGAPVPEARAFIYRMLTPRLALEIALRAKERAKAFFEQVGTDSRNKSIRALAADFALEEESHIAWVRDALAHLPQPFQPGEEQPDPTITPR